MAEPTTTGIPALAEAMYEAVRAAKGVEGITPPWSQIDGPERVLISGDPHNVQVRETYMVLAATAIKHLRTERDRMLLADRSALITQVAEARRTLRYLADGGRMDDFAYDELSGDLSEGILDEDGRDVIADEVARLDAADFAAREG